MQRPLLRPQMAMRPMVSAKNAGVAVVAKRPARQISRARPSQVMTMAKAMTKKTGMPQRMRPLLPQPLQNAAAPARRGVANRAVQMPRQTCKPLVKQVAAMPRLQKLLSKTQPRRSKSQPRAAVVKRPSPPTPRWLKPLPRLRLKSQPNHWPNPQPSQNLAPAPAAPRRKWRMPPLLRLLHHSPRRPRNRLPPPPMPPPPMPPPHHPRRSRLPRQRRTLHHHRLTMARQSRAKRAGGLWGADNGTVDQRAAGKPAAFFVC